MGVEGDVPLLGTSFIERSAGRGLATPAPRSGPNVLRAIDNLAIQRNRNLSDALQTNLQTLIGR
jgi:hypothetical protein